MTLPRVHDSTSLAYFFPNRARRQSFVQAYIARWFELRIPQKQPVRPPLNATRRPSFALLPPAREATRSHTTRWLAYHRHVTFRWIVRHLLPINVRQLGLWLTGLVGQNLQYDMLVTFNLHPRVRTVWRWLRALEGVESHEVLRECSAARAIEFELSRAILWVHISFIELDIAIVIDRNGAQLNYNTSKLFEHRRRRPVVPQHTASLGQLDLAIGQPQGDCRELSRCSQNGLQQRQILESPIVADSDFSETQLIYGRKTRQQFFDRMLKTKASKSIT